MQPSPSAETVGPLVPSLRWFTPTAYGLTLHGWLRLTTSPRARPDAVPTETNERRSSLALKRARVAILDYNEGSLGLGLGDRLGGSRGGSRSFEGSMLRAEKPSELQGKRLIKRLSQIA